MSDEKTGQAHTAHTMNKVPLLLINGPDRVAALNDGRLADIAPTVLDLMELRRPAAMTGRSLLAPAAERGEAAAESPWRLGSSAERRVGQAGVSTCRARGAPVPSKKKTN